jgi:hypothetical protein
MKRIFNGIIGLAVATALIVGMTGQSLAVGSATFSLSPSGTTVNVHTVFGVTIFENGTDVNVVTADLNYDASKLEFVSIDASGSAFPNAVSASGGNGAVSVSRYTNPGTTVSGNQKVATVNFKALAGSGSTAVSFAGSSKIASNGSDIWNHAPTSATYSFATPAPAPTPTPTPAPTPAPPTTNTAPAATTQQTRRNSTTTATTGPTGEVKDASGNKIEKEVVQAGTVAKKTSYRGTIIALLILGGLVGLVVLVRKLEAANAAAKKKYIAPVKKASKTPAKKATASKSTKKPTPKKTRK